MGLEEVSGFQLGRGSKTASGLGYREALVGTGWAISLHLYANGLTKQSSGIVRPPFSGS